MARIIITVSYENDEGAIQVAESGFLDPKESIGSGISQWLFETIICVKLAGMKKEMEKQK